MNSCLAVAAGLSAVLAYLAENNPESFFAALPNSLKHLGVDVPSWVSYSGLGVAFLILASLNWWLKRSSADANVVMDKVDNRKGIFNEAPNYGTQTYTEAPAQRKAPDGLASVAIGTDLMIQIRVYGMDYEAKVFGAEICKVLLQAGIRVSNFGDDYGTRVFKGVSIDTSKHEPAATVAANFADCFARAGLPVWREVVDVWPGNVVRIGIGANG